MHAPGSARDSGLSLVETVVAVLIMAITVGPLLGAVVASIRTSRSLREVAQVETVLQNAADRVNRAPKKCEYGVYVSAAAQSVGWQANSATATYEYWVPGATPADNGQWVNGACSGATPSDLLVQLVTITVTGPQGNIRRTIQVVKSDV